MIEYHGTGLMVPPNILESQTGTLSEIAQRQLVNTLSLLTERLAELEDATQGWDQINGASEREFSREFLRRITALSRLMFLKNPLINRPVSLQSYYVFGQGLNIAARHPAVNAVIQSFLDDPKNKPELTSQQAREMKEQTLQTDGSLFFVLFTNPSTGRVRVRSIVVDEIDDIITNPDDSRESWYYRRIWTQRGFDSATGFSTVQSRTAYYPDWRYRPSSKPSTIGGNPVEWTAPVYQIKVGGLDGMKFGVPETYAALDWARAYKSFLEDWATIVRAYSRFAWKATTPGGARGVAAARSRLSTTIGADDRTERNPPPTTGATFVAAAGSGSDLAPIRTAGATTSADDGRRMLLMVAAAVGLPESFFGDVSVGTLATAKSLDRPTELKFRSRQTLWADVHQDLLGYVVDQAVVAPLGPLNGTVTNDAEGERVITLAINPETSEPMDRNITVEFPPILEHSVTETINAIVSAGTLDGKTLAVPGLDFQKLITRLTLQALGVEDMDELLETLFPDPADGDAPPTVAANAGALEARARVVGALIEAGVPLESALILAGHPATEVTEILDAKRRQIGRDQLAAREDRIPEVTQ